MVATRESAALAEKLIAATCEQQHIGRGQLTIHADRGSSMTSKPVTFPARRPRRHPATFPTPRQQ
jgi:putative transposase